MTAPIALINGWEYMTFAAKRRDGLEKAMREYGAEPDPEIMISSEMPELLGMCDRIYVMNEGALVGELTAAEASQERIMSLIVND